MPTPERISFPHATSPQEAGFTHPAEQLAYLHGFQAGQTYGQVAMAAMAEDRRRYDNTHETMTGLLNREGLFTALDQWADRPEDKLIIYMDCRKFKTINDTLGHSTGDKILKSIADVMRGSFRNGEPHPDFPDYPRPADVLANVARLGGDEFVAAMLLNPDYTLEHQVGLVEGRIQNNMKALYVKHEGVEELGFGLSMGAAIWSHGQPLKTALDTADKRLYRIKDLQAKGKVPPVSGILLHDRED